jgi:RNA polymerase sigma-70 factor (ECF subfamily)
MDPECRNERLSQIATLWSLLEQMHRGPADAASSARRLFLQRYCGAVYRYLLGALRDEDAALELFQEFALRCVRGDFRRADPRCGRFRDYLKAVLVHLVSDYRRARRSQPQSLPPDVLDAEPHAPAAADVDFLHSWREELINRTWEALAKAQPTFHAVLLLHVQQPELPSPRMAEQLAAQLGKPFTATNVRVSLHRAREKFADLLLGEVAHSLGAPTEADLLQELRDLQLLKLCGSAFERRGRPPHGPAGLASGMQVEPGRSGSP